MEEVGIAAKILIVDFPQFDYLPSAQLHPIASALSNTFARIAPAGVVAFFSAQLLAMLVALAWPVGSGGLACHWRVTKPAP